MCYYKFVSTYLIIFKMSTLCMLSHNRYYVIELLLNLQARPGEKKVWLFLGKKKPAHDRPTGRVGLAILGQMRALVGCLHVFFNGEIKEKVHVIPHFL